MKKEVLMTEARWLVGGSATMEAIAFNNYVSGNVGKAVTAAVIGVVMLGGAIYDYGVVVGKRKKNKRRR